MRNLGRRANQWYGQRPGARDIKPTARYHNATTGRSADPIAWHNTAGLDSTPNQPEPNSGDRNSAARHDSDARHHARHRGSELDPGNDAPSGHGQPELNNSWHNARHNAR